STESEVAAMSEEGWVETQLEAIKNIIAVFADRPEDYLVIRHHPNIAANLNSPPELAFLSKMYKNIGILPRNVRIVMPNEKLNSYSLLKNIDICLSLFSTVALEAASRGVIAASSSNA